MGEKKIKFKVQEYSINKVVCDELELSLHERASVIDAINEVDEIIRSKGGFPPQDYGSLLHWVYNPVEGRFYEQTAISAYTASGKFLDVIPGGDFKITSFRKIINLGIRNTTFEMNRKIMAGVV